MNINSKLAIKSVFLLMAFLVVNPTQAETPEGKEELRIHVGTPQKSGDSIISISSHWKNRLGWIAASTSLVIVSGPDRKNPDNGISIAKKVSKAMKVSMIDHDPSMRGLKVSIVDSANDPQIIIKNRKGNDITQLTLRDYTNQKFTVETSGTSFSGKGMQVSLDIVEAAAVDYVVQFVPEAKKNQIFRASGGGVDIRMGNNKSKTIKTESRTLVEIEQAIAHALGGNFSSVPMLADKKERDTRNIKPFDGGEVQFTALTGQAITIDVHDASLGVITRYRFPGAGASAASGGVSLNLALIVILLVVLGAGGYYYYTSTRTEITDTTEEG